MKECIVFGILFGLVGCGDEGQFPTVSADAGGVDVVQRRTDDGALVQPDSGVVAPQPDSGPATDSGTADSAPPSPGCAPQPLSVDRFPEADRTTADGRTFSGWGGTAQPGAAQKIPVVFVHGNGGTAAGWKPFRDHLCKQGYSDREIWAVTFQDYSCAGPCYSGSNTEHATELERFVALVRAQTQAKRVNIVAASMGVTTARYYIKSLGGIKRNEVALAYLVSGPNHGLSDCDIPGASMVNVACAELDSYALSYGWLHDLNTPDETPSGQGDGLPAHQTVIYRTVSYTQDPFFPGSYSSSPQLDGADNLVVNGSQHAAIDLTDLQGYLGKATPAP